MKVTTIGLKTKGLSIELERAGNLDLKMLKGIGLRTQQLKL
jgi:hypothetical protein